MNFNSSRRHRVIITVFTKLCGHPIIFFLLIQILGRQYDTNFSHTQVCVIMNVISSLSHLIHFPSFWVSAGGLLGVNCCILYINSGLEVVFSCPQCGLSSASSLSSWTCVNSSDVCALKRVLFIAVHMFQWGYFPALHKLWYWYFVIVVWLLLLLLLVVQ